MNFEFDSIMEEYFRYSKMKLKKTTYEEQERKIRLYIVPYFKNKNIYEFSIKDIIFWKEYIESKNFSYNYNSYLFYCMCSIMDFLMKFYDLKCNYARLEGNFKNKEPHKIGNYWSIEEFNQFLSVIENKEDRILFKLLYFSGMRKGEILALKYSDINIYDNTININKSITRNHELLSTKTMSSNRIITLSNNIIKEIFELKENNSDDQLIFNMSFTTLKRKKDYYCNLSGVKQIKIHEFRHSHSIYLYLNNIPIDEIQHRLGHTNMSTTTDTYLKYLPRNEKRVIKLLNSVC